MRVLAIGATGFIGRHVVRKLAAAGHEVAVFHRGSTAVAAQKGVTEIIGDRAAMDEMRERFREFAPDVAIDMILSSAAQAQADVEALRGVARRIVAVSSGDVYRAMAVLHRLEGGPPERVPLREDAPLRTQSQTYSPEALAAARNVFGWLDAEYDKVQVERVIRSSPDLPATVIRLPMVYGEGDPLHRLYPVAKRIADGRPVFLEESVAQWVPCRGYVENVADAIVLAAVSEKAAGRVYNVADRVSCSEADWTRKVAAVVTVPREKAPPHLVKPHNFAQHLFLDSEAIRAELGYTEAVASEEALRRTIAWELANPPAVIDPAQFDYAAEDRSTQ